MSINIKFISDIPIFKLKYKIMIDINNKITTGNNINLISYISILIFLKSSEEIEKKSSIDDKING
jgi:hypothetical protein